MKGDKKILVVAILVLLLSVCFSTYAIYRSSANGSGTVTAAAWQVKVKGNDISSASFTFGYNDINWTTLTGYNDTIAPGSSGTITIPVDATGSEVDVIITAALGTGMTLPNGMSVTVADGGTVNIPYSTVTDAMKTNVTLNIAWTGTDDDIESKDTSDKTQSGNNITIPVTLTAKQSVTGH